MPLLFPSELHFSKVCPSFCFHEPKLFIILLIRSYKILSEPISTIGCMLVCVSSLYHVAWLNDARVNSSGRFQISEHWWHPFLAISCVIFADHYNLASVIKRSAAKWSWWLWLWFFIYEPSHPCCQKIKCTFSRVHFLFMNGRKVKAGCRSPNSEFCCCISPIPVLQPVWTGLQISAFKSTAYSFSTLLHLTCRVKLDDSVAFFSLHNSLGFKVPVTWFRAKSDLHELYCYSHFTVSLRYIFVFFDLLLQTNLSYEKSPV